MTVQEGRPGISCPTSRVRGFGSHPAIQGSTGFPCPPPSAFRTSIGLSLERGGQMAKAGED